MEPTLSERDRWIVMVQGELDVSTSHHLQELAGIFSGLGLGVDLDLGDVTFIDSSGWAGVLAAVEKLEEAGVPTRLVRPSDPVRRVASVPDWAILTRAA